MSYIFVGIKDMGKHIVQKVSISVGIVFIIIGPGAKTFYCLWTAFEIMAIALAIIPPKTHLKISKKISKEIAVLLARFSIKLPPLQESKPLKYIQKPKVCSVRGLSNLGNTCYLNAAIQCLHKTVQLTNQLRIRTLRPKDFVKTYLELMDQLSQEKCWPCDPKEIKKMIERYNSQFFGNRQQDSSQVLMAFLNYISEETQEIDKPKFTEPDLSIEDNQKLCNAFKERDSLRSKSIIDDIFIGRFLTIYECQICEKQEKLFEKFHLMHLPIPRKNGITLEDCMRQFCKPDVLVGENAWWCDRCGKDTPTHKFMSVYEANKIVMICLKRFNYKGDKIKDQIHFDQEITLKDISTNPKTQGNKYELFGVINHSGFSLNYGHYYSYCHDGTTWKEYNDSIVRPEPNIVTDNAFVLFYRKKQT